MKVPGSSSSTLLAADRRLRPPRPESAGATARGRGGGDRLHRHETDVVAVAGVARAGIAEADEEQHGFSGVAAVLDRTPRRRQPVLSAPVTSSRAWPAQRRRRAQHAGSRRSTRRSAGRGTRRGSGTFGAGRGTGSSGSGSGSSGSSSGFGGGLDFFGVAGRRHDGDQRHVGRARSRVTFGGSVTSLRCFEWLMSRLGDVDVDRFRNVVGRAHHLDGMGDDVDRAAALDAGRLLGVEHVHRDVARGWWRLPTTRRKSTCIGRSLTGSSWKSRGITRCFAPSTSIS